MIVPMLITSSFTFVHVGERFRDRGRCEVAGLWVLTIAARSRCGGGFSTPDTADDQRRQDDDDDDGNDYCKDRQYDDVTLWYRHGSDVCGVTGTGRRCVDEMQPIVICHRRHRGYQQQHPFITREAAQSKKHRTNIMLYTPHQRLDFKNNNQQS